MNLARETVPGFCVVVRWYRVNFWPFVHLQFWRWSATTEYAPPYRTAEVRDW